ncbi:MAG: anti-sigma factor [Methylobacterium sp.]|uniref:anti-sigma factor family protein n=1 Tax=Methylobacterium sp. TaxID=409 RepID=UPI0025D42AA6|nr:anti-sigma factor [Methylobacterium sp.]MBX9933440.1 anti-sigma factor [Methylobacterium sp.]
MSADHRPVGEDDLHAWIDGCLPVGRVEIVEAYLATHPEAAAKAAADREGNAQLRARLAAVAEEPIPARLQVANLVAAGRNRWRRRFGAVAAAMAWIVLGGFGSWLGHDLLPSSGEGQKVAGASLATRDAVAAFRTFAVEVTHPVEVGADQKPHLVQWLSRRLNRTVVVPDLSGQGFRLMGGRLLPTESEPAALLMYDDDRGTRLIVYTRVGHGEEARSAFRPAREGDVTTWDWTQAGQSYVVTARADASRLLSVAEAIDGQVRSLGGRI